MNNVVKWADIEAEADSSGFRERLVTVFKKYEGQPTDEKDSYNRTVKVTASSFARHMGVAEGTFKGWVRKMGSNAGPIPPSETKKASDRRFVKSTLKADPEALNDAIRESPEVAAAAAQALVDKGDINSLSKAMTAVAKNRQVERNRKRVTNGGTKQKSVEDPKPTISDDAGVNAFLSVKGLADALRSLVTTFPQEWAALSVEAQHDEDFIGVCEETLDKIDIASAACRGLISGGVTDAELASILEGGE